MPESTVLPQELAPVWARAMAARGIDTGVALELWRERHGQPPVPEREGMLHRWARGEARITDLSRELDVAHSRVQAQLTDTALRLIVPLLEDLPRWARARAAGIADADIAALSGTTELVVAMEVSPDTSGPSEAAVVEAHRLWVEGAPRAEVACALGLPTSQLARQMGKGLSVLTPRRLLARDLRERFGWTTSAQSLYRRKGVLPGPDGVDGATFWWWASTIERWEQATDLSWCRDCSHAFATERGLREHRGRMHSR